MCCKLLCAMVHFLYRWSLVLENWLFMMALFCLDTIPTETVVLNWHHAVLLFWSALSTTTSSCFNNQLIVLVKSHTFPCACLLSWANMLLYFVLYVSKLLIFWFWSDTKSSVKVFPSALGYCDGPSSLFPDIFFFLTNDNSIHFLFFNFVNVQIS